MAERRRYTKRQKSDAVIVAMASSASAAAEQQGIPRKTVAYWLDSPEFAELRQKTREDMAVESRVLAHIALDQIKSRIKEYEPRDLSVLFGILVDKAQLLAGAATARLEVNDVATLDDHETQTLRDWLDSLPIVDLSEADAHPTG